MEILNNLVIERRTPKYKDDKPYRLYIYGNGPVGDKLNMSNGSVGEIFPMEATSDFDTEEEAIDAYYKFYKYVEMKIKQAKSKDKGTSTNDKDTKKKSGRPSYFLWS